MTRITKQKKQKLIANYGECFNISAVQNKNDHLKIFVCDVLLDNEDEINK